MRFDGRTAQVELRSDLLVVAAVGGVHGSRRAWWCTAPSVGTIRALDRIRAASWPAPDRHATIGAGVVPEASASSVWQRAPSGWSEQRGRRIRAATLPRRRAGRGDERLDGVVHIMSPGWRVPRRTRVSGCPCARRRRSPLTSATGPIGRRVNATPFQSPIARAAASPSSASSRAWARRPASTSTALVRKACMRRSCGSPICSTIARAVSACWSAEVIRPACRSMSISTSSSSVKPRVCSSPDAGGFHDVLHHIARAVQVVLEAALEPEVERRTFVEHGQLVEPLVGVGAALEKTRRHVQQPRLEAADGAERHRHEGRVADALGALHAERCDGLVAQPAQRHGQHSGRRDVEPVHVVQRQQHRPPRCQCAQDIQEGQADRAHVRSAAVLRLGEQQRHLERPGAAGRAARRGPRRRREPGGPRAQRTRRRSRHARCGGQARSSRRPPPHGRPAPTAPSCRCPARRRASGRAARPPFRPRASRLGRRQQMHGVARAERCRLLAELAQMRPAST